MIRLNDDYCYESDFKTWTIENDVVNIVRIIIEDRDSRSFLEYAFRQDTTPSFEFEKGSYYLMRYSILGIYPNH